MTDGRTDRRTDGRTDGGDCNIPDAFLKSVGITSYHYQNNCIYVKIQRSIIIGGTQIITNKRKIHLFDKIIHLSMQFSAVLNIFIVKT